MDTGAALIRRDACDAIISELIELLTGGYDDTSAAAELNRRGHRDSGGDRFTRSSVMGIRQNYRLPDSISCQRHQLRDRGYCTASDLWRPTWNQCKCGIQACALKQRHSCLLVQSRQAEILHVQAVI